MDYFYVCRSGAKGLTYTEWYYLPAGRKRKLKEAADKVNEQVKKELG